MKTWKERLEEAEERRAFTDEDKALSRTWTTCAVGENAQGAEIEVGRALLLKSGGRSVYSMGMEFTGAVHTDDFSTANELYKAIQFAIERGEA